MAKFFLIGNWKAHGSKHEIDKFLEEYQNLSSQAEPSKNVSTFIALPYPYIDYGFNQIKRLSLRDIKIIAQSVSSCSEGAFTGEVNALMLQDLGVNFTLVGHSERQIFFKETVDDLKNKLINLEHSNVRAILCFGEAQEKEIEETTRELFNTLETLISSLNQNYRTSILFAYEPYWAIGGKNPASSERVSLIFKLLSEKIKKRFSFTPAFLYGGSVNEESIDGLLEFSSFFSGFLVGGASLHASSFKKIEKKMIYHRNATQNQIQKVQENQRHL